MAMLKLSFFMVAFLVSLMLGCVSQPPSLLPPSQSTQKQLGAPWQAEWDNTLALAKSEGELLIYSGGGRQDQLVSAFREKYGINIDLLIGRSEELEQKVLAQKAAGLNMLDLLISGKMPHSSLFAAGVLVPIRPLLILPEVLDNKAYFDDDIPFADKERKYTVTIGPYVSMNLAINSDLVKLGEIKGYGDLLDSKWKGKISINDPTTEGQGTRWFLMTSEVLMNLDFHRQLVKQEPVLTRDRRLQLEWLAKGKYPIAVAPSVPAFADFKKAGAPIKWVLPKEGLYLASVGSGMVSYMSKAPHPSASKVFVNWLLSKEGLTIWSRETLSQSARKDVPTDFLDQDLLRDPNVKYYDATKQDIALKQEESLKLAKEVYGSLLR